MKKMTNGKDVKFVADALVTAYRNRGYYVEGEEVTPPPPADPEGQSGNQFICPICGKSYAKKAYLDKHMAEKHNQD